MKPRPYRLRIVNDLHNKTYIVRDDKNHVQYLSGKELPLALANLVGEGAAELRFLLEDAFDASEAAKAVRLVLEAQIKRADIRPKVEIV